MKTKHAFSIVELIIVLAVIGILAAILIPVMSNIIGNANAKSALSDAKNTLTNYVAHCESNQMTKKDTCIIVENAKAYYAFGYFVSINELIESNQNPYKAESLQDAITKLKSAEVIIPLGADAKDITATLPDISENVLVYEGYSLQPIGELITLDKEQLGLIKDESYTLTATIFPERQGLPITWESANEAIATVTNGEVVGVSRGETEVTVHYGDVSAVCKVIVDEFIEFSGNMAELKTLIENDNNTVFIKLMDDIYLEDYPDIFPIVIPENKVVRIDFNRNELGYSYSSLQNSVYAFFINDGGEFNLESYGYFKDGYIFMGTEGSAPDFDTSGYIIENRNGGLVNIVDTICVVVSGAKGGNNHAVHNQDGTVIINKGECDGRSGVGIYNGVNGRLIINDPNGVSGGEAGIINYGLIDGIAKGDFRGDTCIRNYGLIKEISGGKFYGNIAIENIGKKAVIEKISGGEFGYNYYEATFEGETALLLKDGSTIGAITGGTFYGTETIVCDDSSNITQGISGGKFRAQVPARLLFKGKTCIYNESIKMFVVE